MAPAVFDGKGQSSLMARFFRHILCLLKNEYTGKPMLLLLPGN